MYQDHFAMQKKPFGVTPDPNFLFEGKCHREALAGLIYGVRESRGLMTLIGEVGTGKSTLVRALLDRLDPALRTVFISHTTFERSQILQLILSEFGVDEGPQDPVRMLNRLHAFCVAQVVGGNPPPLMIIDEAQNLSIGVLEEIRLLTNLETVHSKLLQIILAGQPELDLKLLLPELRQLKQRIAVRAELRPFSLEDTTAYIRRRLSIAGCSSELFSSTSMGLIQNASGGIPRVINLICEQSLVNAFGMGSSRPEDRQVAEAIDDLALGTVAPDRFQVPLRDYPGQTPLHVPGEMPVSNLPQEPLPVPTKPAAPILAKPSPEKVDDGSWKKALKQHWEAKMERRQGLEEAEDSAKSWPSKEVEAK